MAKMTDKEKSQMGEAIKAYLTEHPKATNDEMAVDVRFQARLKELGFEKLDGRVVRGVRNEMGGVGTDPKVAAQKRRAGAEKTVADAASFNSGEVEARATEKFQQLLGETQILLTTHFKGDIAKARAVLADLGKMTGDVSGALNTIEMVANGINGKPGEAFGVDGIHYRADEKPLDRGLDPEALHAAQEGDSLTPDEREALAGAKGRKGKGVKRTSVAHH